MFQDQLNHISRGEFTLGLSDLAKLMDQMQRCWAFVKQTRATAAAQQAQQINAPSMDSASSRPLDHRSPSDPFSLMAQKNTGLRVEDLKPPPMKLRKSISQSGQSPVISHTELESPPKDGVSRAKGKLPATRSKSTSRDETVDELSLSLKRKRELEESRNDSDNFIEKSLKLVKTVNLFNSSSAEQINLIPTAINNQSNISFSQSLNSTQLRPPIEPITIQRPPLDFDFFIDSTAAGYDDDNLTAPTPDLITNTEPSPSSDDELEKSNSILATNSLPSHYTTNSSLPSTAHPTTSVNQFGPMTGGNNGEVEDFEKWLQSGENLPNSFSWEGDELPRGNWELFSTDSL